MKPIKFPQSNMLLTRPPDMTEEECSSLHVHRAFNHDAFISCWVPSWRERLAIFLGKPVWLWVMHVHAHPPISIEVQDPFEKPSLFDFLKR